MNQPPLFFALFGNPVGHSLSPAMHRAAFAAMGLNAEYAAFCVRDLAAAVQGVRGMDIRGVSVTVPFKTEVMDLLDDLDESARAVGAVNTIVNDNGRLTGHNTDASGLAADLSEVMDLAGRRVVVLGAGGAARAAVFAAIQKGASVCVVNRTREPGEALARIFGSSFCPLSDAAQLDGDILIHATPVGMTPHADRTPIDTDLLTRFRWVVDLVYNPLQTRLLREAEATGCSVRSGVGMLVHQGAGQIRLWTGRTAPVEVMRQVVLERLAS